MTNEARTIDFRMTGLTERGRVNLLEGRTMQAGERPCYATSFATIRAWAASAKANGVTGIEIAFTLHTRRSGWGRTVWVRF